MILGAHVSAAGGLHNAIGNGEELGCDVVQIFIKNPNHWISTGHTDDAIDGFKEAWKRSSIQTVVVHDIHLTNLASPKPDVLKKSRVQFREQIQLADRLGIPYIVTHLGAHLETGEAEGLEMLSHSFNQLFEDTNDTSVSVLLETTAGQGTNLGYRFEHLRQIIDTSKYPDRLGVCLDTCHVFAAGYELRSEEAYHQTFDQFDRIIGLDRLLTFHLNDAKSEYNSRIDRHEHIGEGNLGITPFQLLVNDSRFSHTPMIIETPKMEEMHAVNLAVLRELVETG